MKFALLFLLSVSAHAGYFADHVNESIVINKERRKYYSELTSGKSDAAFKKLISVERLIVPSAHIYDLRASYFHKRGVPVFANEFVPMHVPESSSERKIPTNGITDIPWKNYKKELSDLVKKRDQEKLLTRSLEIIKEMQSQPQYWCLTRHLVESVYRFAWFYPQRLSEARAKGVRSPAKLMWEVMDYHLLGFSRFVKVDQLAAPVQKEGIPMICAELPDLLIDLK